MAVGLSGYRAFYMTIRVRDEASRGAQNIGRAIGAMGDKAEISRQKMMGVGRGLMSFGTGMIAAGATGVGVLSSMTREALQFGQQTAYAFTQVDEVGASLEQLRDIAKNVASEVPLPLEQLSEGLYDIFSTIDISMENSEAALTGFAKAALAGNTTVRTSARSAISVMNAYELQIEDVGDVLDWQFQLVRKGAGTYEDFARTIGLALPAFRAADQDIDTLGGSIAFLTRRGLSASRAATSAARAMELLAQPKAVKSIEALGIQVREADGTFRQLNDIVTDLAEGPFKDLVGPEFRSMFKEIFGSGRIQARRFFDITLKNQAEYNSMVDDFIDKGDAMEKAYDIMFNEPIMRSQELAIQFDLLKLEIGEHLIPAFEMLIGWVSKLVDKWDEIPPSVQKGIVWFAVSASLLFLVGGAAMFAAGAMVLFYAAFLPWLGTAAAGSTVMTYLGLKFLALGGIFKGIIPFIARLVGLLGALATGFMQIAGRIIIVLLGSLMRIGAAFWFAFQAAAWFLGISVGTLAAILIAIAVAIYLVVRYWDQIWPAVKKAWFWTAALADVIWDSLIGALYATGRWFSSLGSTIVDGIKTGFGATVNAFKVGWFAVMAATDIAWEGIKKGLSSSWDWIAKKASAFGSMLVNDVWVPAWSFVSEYTSKIWKNIMSALATVWDEIVSAITGSFNAIKNGAAYVWNAVYDTSIEIWNKIKEELSPTWDTIFDTLKGIWDDIIGWFDTNFATPLVDTLSSAWAEMGEKLGPAWDIIADNGATAWDLFVSDFQAFADTLEPIWSDAWAAMEYTGEGIWSGLKWSFWGFVDAMIWIFDNALAPAWSWTWNAMKIAASAVWGAMKVAWSSTVDFMAKLPGRTWTGLKAAWYGIKVAWFATWGAMKWTWQNAIWPALKWTGTTSWWLLQGAWKGIQIAWEATWNALKIAWNATIDFMVKLPGRIMTGLEAAWDGIQIAWDATWNAMQIAAEAVWDAILIAAHVFWAAMEIAWEAFVIAWHAVWDGLKWAATEAWDALEIAWDLLWDAMKWTAETAWEGIQIIWDWVVDFAKNVWPVTCDLLSSAWDIAWSAMKVAAEGAWDGISWVFGKIEDFINLIWPELLPALETAWDATWKAMEVAITASWDAIKWTLDQIKHFGEWIWPDDIDWFLSAWDTVWYGIKWTVNTIWEAIKTTLRKVKGWAETTWTTAVNAFQIAWDLAWDTIYASLEIVLSLINIALAVFTGDWTTAKDEIIDIADALKEGIFGFFWDAGTWLYGAGSDLVQGLWDGFTTKWDEFWTWLSSLPDKLKGLFDWLPFISGTGGSGDRDLAATLLAQNRQNEEAARAAEAARVAAAAATVHKTISSYTAEEAMRMLADPNANMAQFLMSNSNNMSGVFANGGIVTRPTLGLVGEAGPEAIVPLSQLGEMGGPGGQSITVNVYGRPEEDDVTFARRVALAVGEEVFANGY